MPGSPHSPLRRRLLSATTCLLPAGCAAPDLLPPPRGPVAPPTVRVGQRWRYESLDLFRGEQVGVLVAEVVRAAAPPASAREDSTATSPIVVALSDAAGAPTGEERWARAWDVIVEPAYDVVQTFETPMPLLPERLEPGARRFDATWYRVPQSNARLVWRQWLRATGWERIAVPAGTFEALRVERQIVFDYRDAWRQRTRRSDTLWYAPAVNRWVQREWSGEYGWPGVRWPAVFHEERVRWRLLDWQDAGAPAR